MTKQECLKALGQCLAACNTCYTKCLKEEDINHMRECIKIDRQCAMVVSLTMKTIELEGSCSSLQRICRLKKSPHFI
ncbi:four-helix bundle copper-binding protein [Priestia endophytica]|uniref:four-helix bundle copper-binding protein n=1 Tax=Priestia endophytica TaxID=135735 RepID=UPI002282691F|nr:four-helix bundle copper-binding protein [Priestia endophytica]MCY8231442.1 four-helix bundle copper-binding protein [Priestia endophytica]